MRTVDRVAWLCVPGDRPRRSRKAHESGADVVIIDLEDVVSEKDKRGARQEAIKFSAEIEKDQGEGPGVHSRIDSIDSVEGLIPHAHFSIY